MTSYTPQFGPTAPLSAIVPRSVETIGRADLPSWVMTGTGHQVSSIGDITEHGHGRGAKVMVTGQVAPCAAVAPDARGAGVKPGVTARPRRATRARACGVGEDNEQRYARLQSEWQDAAELARTDAVTDEIMREGEAAQATARARRAAIVSAVGKASWLGVHLLHVGDKAASKAARRIVAQRGVAPSATSVEDSAADAVANVLASVRKLDRVPRESFEHCGDKACYGVACATNIGNRLNLHRWVKKWREASDEQRKAMSEPVLKTHPCDKCNRAARLNLVVGMYAGRGAFRSLASWASNGATGDNTVERKARRNRDKFGSWFSFEQLVCDALGRVDADGNATGDLAECDVAAEQSAFTFGQSVSARRALARWVYRVGFVAWCAGLPRVSNPRLAGARARAEQAALQRCRVVASVILGATVTDACAANEFASVQSFFESCKAADFFGVLQRAACESADVESARVAVRRYGLEVNALTHALRASGGKYWRAQGGTVRAARTAMIAAGDWRGKRAPQGARYGRGTFGASRRVILAPTTGAVIPHAVQVRTLRRSLARAVELARHWRGVVTARQSEQRAAWARVSKGLQSDFGDLRLVMGLAIKDKLGRVRTLNRGGRKAINPAMIRRARA